MTSEQQTYPIARYQEMINNSAFQAIRYAFNCSDEYVMAKLEEIRPKTSRVSFGVEQYGYGFGLRHLKDAYSKALSDIEGIVEFFSFLPYAGYNALEQVEIADRYQDYICNGTHESRNRVVGMINSKSRDFGMVGTIL